MNDGLGFLLSLVALIVPLALAWLLVAKDRPDQDSMRYLGNRHTGHVNHNRRR